jgi:hypothetical protein
VYNPDGFSLAGLTQVGNHFEDGSPYANPNAALTVSWNDLNPLVRANGIDPVAYAGWLATARGAFALS